ncbi:hypothetical protein A3L09_00130 [Thermococcus profundus]|uniref:Restriction endonuclease type IV Mrr domain-containing protein n=1 Tax=Thermococcus profundus TaxID=49899 RepID=A0A2Z2M664_THEPR|nr:hypothetical protein [Thermococcus profundus]ASJ01780.1 hypothetical protein A3L09_00130 [Thermococcus profundus]
MFFKPFISCTFRCPKIKVKTLTKQIIELSSELGLQAVPEYRTPDGTRIDIAILNGEEKLLAIELEASFKWFPQRLLYDVVKAYRAGFTELWVVSNFNSKPGWVKNYSTEIGVETRIVKENEVLEELTTRLLQQTKKKEGHYLDFLGANVRV